MPKKAEDPKQWLPTTEIKDVDCDILQFWSIHHLNIAAYRNFEKPTQTIASYTSALKAIESALSGRKIFHLTAFDVFDIIQSVRGRYTANGEYVEYSPNTLAKRLTAIQDILRYFESTTMHPSPLSKPVMKYLKTNKLFILESSSEIKTRLLSEVNKKILPRSLNIKQEQSIMRKVIRNLERDGRWLGIAILLWCGMRINVACGLRFGDIIPLSDMPNRHKIVLSDALTKDGKRTEFMKNRFGPRAIPEYVELQCIIEKRVALIRQNLGVSDISHLPVITIGNDYDHPCPPNALAHFAQDVLRKVFTPEDIAQLILLSQLEAIDDMQNAPSGKISFDLSADLQFGSRIFRRNVFTKLYSESLLKDWEIRLTMGHETDSPILSPFSDSPLFDRLKAADHRMILPEIHPGWYTIVTPDADTQWLESCGVHYVSIPAEFRPQIKGIQIEVTLDNPGDNWLLEFSRQFPSDAVSITNEYIPKRLTTSDNRTNTDAVHWPLSWYEAEKALKRWREQFPALDDVASEESDQSES